MPLNFSQVIRQYLARNTRIPYQEQRDMTDLATRLTQPKAKVDISMCARMLIDQDNQPIAEATSNGLIDPITGDPLFSDTSGNIDAGHSDSIYGGTDPIDSGSS